MKVQGCCESAGGQPPGWRIGAGAITFILGTFVLGIGSAAGWPVSSRPIPKFQPQPADVVERPQLPFTGGTAKPIGACCTVEGDCLNRTHDGCATMGGDPQGVGTKCGSASTCQPLSWAQVAASSSESSEPDCLWAWGEWSIVASSRWFVADDWPCEPGQPVTSVRWWGSYIGWDGEESMEVPISFHIGVWTDAARGSGPFGYPGALIHEWVVPLDATTERLVARSFHPACTPEPEASFRYEFDVPEGDYFYQSDDCSAYWLSISAVYATRGEPEYPWGWQTRCDAFQAAAMRITEPKVPTLDAVFVEGGPIPELDGESWDMAFVLATCETRKFADFAPATSGDGVVDGQDVVYILDAFMDAEQFQAGDVFPCGGNGVIDVDDILAVLDVLLGERVCPNPCM